MHLQGKVENNPNYILLSEYFDEDEVERIIQSGISINRVGVVPSLQVPPGNQGCQGLDGLGGLGAMLDAAPTGLTRNFITGELGGLGVWDPRDPMAHLSTDLQTLLASDSPCMCVTTPCNCGTSMEPVRYQASEVPGPDPALEWVEDNWLMIAAGLGGLLLLSVVTKK